MATPSDALIKGKWWEMFGDPQLNRLEELVNVNNQNVKQAEAQFREARAAVARQSRELLSDDRRDAIDHAETLQHGRIAASQSFSLPVAASWEPDLWGRVRLSVRECRGQRAGERGRSRKYPAQPAGAVGDRLLFAGRARTCR